MEQDIIERKPTSPIASSLLVLSAVCLLVAMVFQFLELRELKGASDTPSLNAAKIAKSVTNSGEYRALKSTVGDIELPEDDDSDDPDDGDSDDPDDGDGDDGDGGG